MQAVFIFSQSSVCIVSVLMTFDEVKTRTYAHFVITHKILSVAASLSPTIVHLVDI